MLNAQKISGNLTSEKKSHYKVPGRAGSGKLERLFLILRSHGPKPIVRL
jgi:hypothetical protein